MSLLLIIQWIIEIIIHRIKKWIIILFYLVKKADKNNLAF